MWVSGVFAVRCCGVCPRTMYLYVPQRLAPFPSNVVFVRVFFFFPRPLRRHADFLMQYVKKDKLTELLAEKLCARLAASETGRQAQAVSYCLGRLKVRGPGDVE